MEPLRIGIVGCGAISGIYLQNFAKFAGTEVVAVADIDTERAKKVASENSVARALSPKELLEDPEVELVLNITVPKAHASVAMAAVEAGKHVYNEKPLAIELEDAQALLDAAEAKGVLVGCAPDTFLGAGIQTCRRLIDRGDIGEPVGAHAFMLSRGPESWHPSPEFYYEVGGGPMLDMGPYYITALLNLLGPAKRISGAATIAIPERTITSQPKAGKKITVETPDHIAGTIEFASGAMGTIITSFATRFSEHDNRQPIKIFGTEGTLKVPDPNGFDGPVHYRKNGDDDWRWVPHTFVKGYGRSVGLADMAYAIRSGRPHRASAEQAYTVLDMMQA